jgi:hypothetical protein
VDGATRTLLRNTLAELLDDEFSLGKVVSGRYYDARDNNPFVMIYFAEGLTESEALKGLASTDLIIEINLPEVTYCDDDLDEWGDKLKAVIDSTEIMSDRLAGLTYEGFDYPPPDDRPFLSLNLNYTVYNV